MANTYILITHPDGDTAFIVPSFQNAELIKNLKVISAIVGGGILEPHFDNYGAINEAVVLDALLLRFENRKEVVNNIPAALLPYVLLLWRYDKEPLLDAKMIVPLNADQLFNFVGDIVVIRLD